MASDFIYPIIANVYLIWAWVNYRQCKHDRIVLITLLLFEVMIVTRFFQNILNNVESSRNSMWYRMVNSTVVPLIYSLAQCAVYYFIFQLERVRLLMVETSNNRETVKFNSDQNHIKIMQYMAIGSTLLQVVLVATYNIIYF